MYECGRKLESRRPMTLMRAPAGPNPQPSRPQPLQLPTGALIGAPDANHRSGGKGPIKSRIYFELPRTAHCAPPPARPPPGSRCAACFCRCIRLLPVLPVLPVLPGAPSSAAPGQNGNAARARIELAADNVEVAPGGAMARITVRRSRGLRDEVSFKWWTESGTAKPGQDFVPVKSQVEYIENGKNSGRPSSCLSSWIPRGAQPGNFYVVIDEASDNAALGPADLDHGGPSPEPSKHRSAQCNRAQTHVPLCVVGPSCT